VRSPASYRDPDAWVFVRRGEVYRQINRAYRPHYDRLMSSGLYAALVEEGLLVRHEESDIPPESPEESWRILKPERIPFVSYPWEWCFGAFKALALALLRTQRLALDRGMTLKDASAFNMQLLRGKPVLMDTSSFEIYEEGTPWLAYRQFCQHFLAPLALMARRDVRLSQLTRAFLDGVPLDLAAGLMPLRTWASPRLMTHLRLHAWFQRHYAGEGRGGRVRPMSRYALLGLLDSLRETVAGLTWRPPRTVWSDYYAHTNYTESAFARKREIVGSYLERLAPATVWDLGASTGVFSRLAAARGCDTVAFDQDPAAVEAAWREASAQHEARLLPLVMDLTNPTPSCGWAGRERMSLAERGPADTALALALIHHLAIGANVPLDHAAEHLAALGRTLIVKFVPKEDSQTRRLLASRRDVFPEYRQDAFERAFAKHFEVLDAQPLPDSARRLYLMRRRTP